MEVEELRGCSEVIHTKQILNFQSWLSTFWWIVVAWEFEVTLWQIYKVEVKSSKDDLSTIWYKLVPVEKFVRSLQFSNQSNSVFLFLRETFVLGLVCHCFRILKMTSVVEHGFSLLTTLLCVRAVQIIIQRRSKKLPTDKLHYYAVDAFKFFLVIAGLRRVVLIRLWLLLILLSFGSRGWNLQFLSIR